MSDAAHERLLEKLRASLNEGSFVKLTLSDPRASAGDLHNVYGRVVTIKGAPKLSLVFHHARRDETKNFDFEPGVARVGELLETTLARGYLLTTGSDWQWSHGALKASRRRLTVAPAPEHDRKKAAPLAGETPFLVALGVTNAVGEPRPGMADKLRQIQRFTELLGHLLDDSPLLLARRELRVLDMGAGKGYLTFAAHAFLRSRGVVAEVTGVEVRDDLAAFTERTARELGCDGLRFVRGAIGEYQPPGPIDAHRAARLRHGDGRRALPGNASRRRAARHRALLPQGNPRAASAAAGAARRPPPRHSAERGGIGDRRLRALLLEIHGFKASVFEFISPEHTSKNLMLAAHRRAQPLDSGARERSVRCSISMASACRHACAALGEQ